MARALIIAVILVALGGTYLFIKLGEQPDSGVAASLAETDITTATEEEETAVYTLEVKYPQFGIPAIDADIEAKIGAAVSEFKGYPPNPPDSAVAKNEFLGTFEDIYVGPDIISVKLILSQYTGGAHPMTILSGLNYDRATGRQLLQQDAFGMIGMSVEDVAAQATTELSAKLGDAFFPEGTNSNPENFSSFVVNKNSVTFIFQAYQVGPYAAGPQEVSFPRVR